MFKFLKSKKGFTLVELMIVVVIMAILVAVAVPIYSAVTKKAKIKTCAANQREIQGQANSALLGDLITVTDAGLTFTLETKEVNKETVGEWSATAPAGFADMFQKSPFCPEVGAKITVKITKVTAEGADEGGYKIITGCDQTGHQNDIPTT